MHTVLPDVTITADAKANVADAKIHAIVKTN